MKKNVFLKFSMNFIFMLILMLMFISSIFSDPINIEHLETKKGLDTINNSIVNYKHSSLYTYSAISSISKNKGMRRKFCHSYGVSDELSEDVALSQEYIKLVTDENIAYYTVDSYIEIFNNYTEIAKIKAVDGLTLELDWATNYTYEASNTYITPCNLNFGDDTITATASVSNPISYYVRVGQKEKYHISRIIFSAYDNATINLSTFVGISALTNGMQLLLIGTHSDHLQHSHFIAEFKENFDMVGLMYDVTIAEKSVGVYAIYGRWTFTKFTPGGMILDGSQNDYIEMKIRDDLTDITKFEIEVQGWLETIE